MVATRELNEQPASQELGFLLVAGEGERRRAIRLYDGCILIGSHPSCHLQVCDPTVSRCHLEVTVIEKGLAIRDLASTNGTWIDGHRIRAATVGDGDVMTVGQCDIAISTLAGSRPPCAPPWAREPAGDQADSSTFGQEITSPSVVT